MRYIFFSIVTMYCVSFFSSCKEVGPEINLHGSGAIADTTYVESPVATPATKTVLIEEFTGVQCPNCPAGQTLVAGLETQYPGKIADIALHPNNTLGVPFPFSVQNLIEPNSTALLTYLRNPGFEPSAGIDRQLFSTESYILTNRSSWSGYVQQELMLTPQVNIVLSDQYSPATGQVNVIAELHYIQTPAQPNNITIALTEDSIVTAQLDGTIVDTFYVHNNVLRTLLTNTTGDNVAYNASVSLTAGTVVRLVYSTTLDALWRPEHMHIVAFVHEHATSQVVYQAAVIKLN